MCFDVVVHNPGQIVYHCLLFRKLERISSLHVLCSCLNNMMFLERNIDMGMHAILDTMQFLM